MNESRERLHRGKRKDGGGWREGYYAKIGDLHVLIGLDGQYHGVIPETVGEYTGLADKNGRRIFEGDIVDILCENEEIGVIEWENNAAQFIVSSDGFCANFDNYYGHDLEVIGNIHDDSELLEKEFDTHA